MNDGFEIFGLKSWWYPYTTACTSYRPISHTELLATMNESVNLIQSKLEENMMKVFDWVLISKFDEGATPINNGVITAKSECSAREFIARIFDEDEFCSYKAGDYVLILTEKGKWET